MSTTEDLIREAEQWLDPETGFTFATQWDANQANDLISRLLDAVKEESKTTTEWGYKIIETGYERWCDSKEQALFIGADLPGFALISREVSESKVEIV